MHIFITFFYNKIKQVPCTILLEKCQNYFCRWRVTYSIFFNNCDLQIFHY